MTHPKICVPVVGSNASECELLFQKSAGADFIELRADYLKKPEEAPLIVKKSGLPVIATCRPVKRGGKYGESEEARLRILVECARAGAAFVDLEFECSKSPEAAKAIKEIKKTGAKLILSVHDFKKTPSLEELKQLVSEQRKLGADLSKIVTTAKDFGDNQRIFNLLLCEADKKPVVAFCMGELGVSSRILSPMFGGAFTFACIEYGLESAPGQVSLQDLIDIYRVILRSQQTHGSAA